MSVNLATCTPVEAATLLYPTGDGIVKEIIIPQATARDPQRTGGGVAFWRSDPNLTDTVPVVGFAVGTISPERFLKYMHFANEKAARLSARLMDISSWQSRDESDPDPMRHKYGGAIRCGKELFFSFSGFDEHEDELICTVSAHRLRIIAYRVVRQIAEASNNALLREYYRDGQP